eukprot:scaffold1727_cov133-Cylindrotheca_fusiformis.AAC.13
MDFPCIEALRGHITEKEHGLRLIIMADTDGNHTVQFTTARNASTEWYIHMETVSNTTAITEHDEVVVGGGEERIVQFCHCQTGKYLSTTAVVQQESNDNRRTGTGVQSESTNDTKWIMEKHKKIMSESDDSNGSSFQLRSMLLDLLRISDHSDNDLKQQQPTILNESAMPAVFELEFTSGELCFLTNTVLQQQIRCYPLLGQLSLSSNLQCQEVFRFIEVVLGGSNNRKNNGRRHVLIASWSHAQTFYLTSDSDGNVFTSTTITTHRHQHAWYLEKVDGDGVRIGSVAHPGRYLCAIAAQQRRKGNGHCLYTTTIQPNDYSKWQLEAAHSNTYHFRSLSATTAATASNGVPPYISSKRSGGTWMSHHKRDWEEWKLERTSAEGGSYVTLFSTKHEQFLGSNSAGNVITTKTSGEWSLWEMEQSQLGGIYLKSKAYQRHMAVVVKDDNKDGKSGVLCTTKDRCDAEETWRLEPCLPFFLSTTKIAAMASAGILGVALTVAMPYALLGLVELGAVEAAGLTAMRILVGAGLAGTTGVLVEDDDPSAAMPSSPQHEGGHLTTSFRPISAWRKW